VIGIAAGELHEQALLDESFTPSSLQMLDSVMRDGAFSVSVPTLRGWRYFLEYKDSFEATHWTRCAQVPGNGRIKTLTAWASDVSQRFFQVRQEK
jgi:hypothetical protein